MRRAQPLKTHHYNGATSMSAHEWTRAKQRSVRRETGPAVTTPTETVPVSEAARPPAAPEPAAEKRRGITGFVVPESAVAPPSSEPAAEAEPEPPVAEVAEPPAEPPPAAPVRRPAPRRRAARPAPRQAELPLGLEPVSEAQLRRSATETREELIERLLDPHLSLQETAKLLDVCPTTVRRYTNRGLLAHYRTPGNQRRFRLSDVLAFMERQGIPAHGLDRPRTQLWGETEGSPEAGERATHARGG